MNDEFGDYRECLGCERKWIVLPPAFLSTIICPNCGERMSYSSMVGVIKIKDKELKDEC